VFALQRRCEQFFEAGVDVAAEGDDLQIGASLTQLCLPAERTRADDRALR
jgi:hypothetical protein